MQVGCNEVETDSVASRNSLIGLRTPDVMASDENWERAHKRAAPFFLLESIIWFDSALLLVITAAFDAPELS